MTRIINIPLENPFVKITTIFFLSSLDSSRNSFFASYNANVVSFTLNVFEVKSSSKDNKSVWSLYSFNVIRVSTYLAYASRAKRVFAWLTLNAFTNFLMNIFISCWHFRQPKNCGVESIIRIISVFLAPRQKTWNLLRGHSYMTSIKISREFGSPFSTYPRSSNFGLTTPSPPSPPWTSLIGLDTLLDRGVFSEIKHGQTFKMFYIITCVQISWKINICWTNFEIQENLEFGERSTNFLK